MTVATISNDGEPAESTATTTTIDTNGNCTHHPTIKLRRLQKSTNTWKSILKSCPLCSVRGTTPPRRSDRSRGNNRSQESESLSNSIRSTLSSSAYSHNSSSVRSIPIDTCDNMDNNDSEDEMNKTQHGVDEDENDSLSPLEYSTHHLPPLCKQISTLSIGTSCDATVASTCSATSSQQSILLGSSGMGSMGYVGGDNSNEDQEQRMISPLDSSPSMMQHCQPCSSSPIPPPPLLGPGRGGVTQTRAHSQSSFTRRTRAHPQSSYTTPPPPPPSSKGRKMYNNKSYSSGGLLRTEESSQHNLSKTKKSVVCGQTYTNPINNQIGSYTGQLHPVTQVPHGLGTLRYTNCNGNSSIDEGEWYEGILVDRAPPPPPSLSSTKNAEQVTSMGRRYSSSIVSSRIEGDSNNTSAARSSHRRSSAHTIQEHLNMPRLGYNNKDVSMDDTSWCQPCGDDSVTSPPPPAPARSSNYSPSNSSNSVGGFGMDPSFICSPCSPPPPSCYSTSNKSRERVYPNSTSQYSRQDGQREYSRSSNKVVEVSLPFNFEQQRVHSQQDDDDQGCETDHDGEGSDDDNSLGTYKSQYSKASSSNISRARSVKSHGGGSTRTHSSGGAYSARESKGSNIAT